MSLVTLKGFLSLNGDFSYFPFLCLCHYPDLNTLKAAFFLSLELVGPWMVLGVSVGMEAFDEFLLISVAGVRSSLVFSGFGLKVPVSGFQSYSYNSLKTSPYIRHQ